MTIISKNIEHHLPDSDRQTELWELFHENTKLSRYDYPTPTPLVVATMAQNAESLTYEPAPVTALPDPDDLDPLKLSLGEAITGRVSTREFTERPLTLSELGALLYYTYGVNRDANETGFGRAFRNAPSGGGLFPLELYFVANRVEGLERGIYHYQAVRHEIYKIGDEKSANSSLGALMQKDIAFGAQVTFMIGAFFERAVFKYRDRAYRFLFLEAGHVAQNLNLAAEGLLLGSVNIGGYVDREVDEAFKLDGLTQSIIYIVCVGEKGEDQSPASSTTVNNS